MSFDLGVWRPGDRASTVEEAARFYAELCARPLESFVPGQEMADFVGEVGVHLQRAVAPAFAAVWSVEPQIGADCALLAVNWACAHEARAFVPKLAVARGYVCFDPQAGVVQQPGPERPGPVLELADGSETPDPGDDRIEEAVFRLSRERWFAVLHFGDEDRFFQVGYGDRAGAPAGQYAVEYRDGSEERHWRALTPDRGAIVRAMIEYRDGVDRWERRFSWRQWPENT